MSVKFHEAFSLDSARRRFEFTDHFLGDSLRDLWRTTGSAGGSAVVVDAQDGGIIRLTTDGDDNDAYGLDWNDIRSLHVDKKATIEFRLKSTQATYNQFWLGLFYNTSNRIEFTLDESAGGAVNWKIRCVNGGASTEVDTGIALDTDYHIYRIECFPTGEVSFWIDGVECGNSPITTNIPSDAADYLEPYLFIRTTETATKSMDIDYIAVRHAPLWNRQDTFFWL